VPDMGKGNSHRVVEFRRAGEGRIETLLVKLAD
jgi:hypothetical protein